MKQAQANKHDMMDATNNYLDDNTSIWNAIPVISRHKNQLNGLIQAIQQAAQSQKDAQIFIGKSIKEHKRQVAQKMDILDDGLEAYAEDSGNEVLLSKATNAYSDYFRLPAKEFETKVTSVVAELEANVANMADYAITQELINDAKNSFDNYLQGKGLPRKYQIASRVATLDLKDLFKQSTTVLEKLDRSMKRFKRSNPGFYNGYLSARTIIDS